MMPVVLVQFYWIMFALATLVGVIVGVMAFRRMK